MMRYKFCEIKISDINPGNDFRYRARLDVDDLAASIRRDGQDTPVTCRLHRGRRWKYDLICGYRRLAALRKIGRKTVLAKIFGDVSDFDAHAMSLRENVERESLTAWDQICAVIKLRDQGLKNADIAKAFKRSVRSIQRYLMLSNAPGEFRRALQRDEITIQGAYEAISKGVPLSEVIKQGRSVRYLRGLSRKSKLTRDIVVKRTRNGGIFFQLRFRPGETDVGAAEKAWMEVQQDMRQSKR